MGNLLRKSAITIEDLSALLMIICTLTFNENVIIFLGAQVLFVLINLFYCKSINALQLKYIIRWIFFIIVCFASYLWAFNTKTVVSSIASTIQVALIGSIFILYTNTIERVNKSIFYYIIGAVCLCIRFLVSVPFAYWETERLGDYLGYNSNTVGQIFSYAVLLSYYLGRSVNKIYYLLAVLFGVLSYLTGSRKAFFVIAIGILFLIILNSKNRKKVVLNLLIAAVFIGALYYAVIKVDVFYNIMGNRIESLILTLTGGTGDRSSQDRLYLITYGWSEFLKYPILGVGLDGFRYLSSSRGYYAHNNYIELLCDLGIAGFILYYGLWIKVLCQGTIKMFKSKQDYSLIITIILCILIMDMANVSYSDEITQIILATAYGLFVIKNETTEKIA